MIDIGSKGISMKFRQTLIAIGFSALAVAVGLVIIPMTSQAKVTSRTAKLSPKTVALRQRQRVRLDTAQRNWDNGDLAGAESNFRSFLKEEPNNHLVLYDLGRVLHRRNNLTAAHEVFKKIGHPSADSGSNLMSVTDFLVESVDIAEAVKDSAECEFLFDRILELPYKRLSAFMPSVDESYSSVKEQEAKARTILGMGLEREG